MSDFVNENLVELNISKKGFWYKPTTAGDENEWLNEYLVLEDGKHKQDLSKLNKCKLSNIKKVPYSDDELKEVVGKTNFESWNIDDKYKLFSKLKPSLFDELITAISKVDIGDVETKNC